MNAIKIERRSHTTQAILRGVLLVLAVVALGVALATLPLFAAGGLVGGVFGVLATLAQPLIGLALLLLSVPFGSPFNVQVGGFNFGPTELLFALLLASWLGQMVIRREVSTPTPQRSLRVVWIVGPLLAFIGVLMLTLSITHSLPVSLKELIKWLEILLVVLFMVHTLEQRHIPWVLVLLFLSAAIESVIGLYQTYARLGPQPFFVPLGGQLVMRSYGTFEQPNPFAGYLNFSLPIIVSLWVSWVFDRFGTAKGEPRADSTRDTPSSTLYTLSRGSSSFLLVVAAVCLPIIGGAFFFSLSRGAWLGLALACAMIISFRSRRALLLLGVGALVGVALLFLGSLDILPAAIADRIAEVPAFLGLNLLDPTTVKITNENFAIVDRMAHWYAAWRMFGDFPWLGVGIGNYPVVYDQYNIPFWSESLGHAHNIYLNMLAETGLIGLTFYLLFVLTTMGYAWRVSRRQTGLWRATALGILGALIAMAAHNLFDNLWVHGMNIQFAMLLGLLGCMKDT